MAEGVRARSVGVPKDCGGREVPRGRRTYLLVLVPRRAHAAPSYAARRAVCLARRTVARTLRAFRPRRAGGWRAGDARARRRPRAPALPAARQRSPARASARRRAPALARPRSPAL